MPNKYLVVNGPMPTTAAPAAVSTGTAIKTMLQLVPSVPIWICRWGWSCDADAAATPGALELLTTGTVAATVTAFAAADVMPLSDPNAPVNTAGATGNPLELGTTLSGYTATVEGAITATRVFDTKLQDPLFDYLLQFPSDDLPMVGPGEVLRIRNTFAAAVNARCFVEFAV